MQHENQQQVPLLYLSPTLPAFRGPLICNSKKRKAVVSQKIFWRPWQNGWVSITVMRLQEWPPRFPHLRHLSLRLLQGIHSFLYNSLLSLLLLPLSFALCSHSLFTTPEIYKRCVHLCVCAPGRNVSCRRLGVNEECWYVSSYRPFIAWTRST